MYGRGNNVKLTKGYNIRNPETKEYDIDKIVEIYKFFYFYNLKVSLEYFDFKWIDPSKLKIVDKRFKFSDMDESERLKKEMLTVGSYHPMFIFENRLLSEYEVYVGNHRTSVIQKMIERGEWPKGKEILVCIIPKLLKGAKTKLTTRHHEDINIPLPKPGTLYLLSHIREQKYYYLDIQNERTVKDGISFVTMDRYLAYFKLLVNISDAMGPIMYQYTLDHGAPPKEVIEISRFLNDKEEFEKWLKGEGDYDIEKYRPNIVRFNRKLDT